MDKDNDVLMTILNGSRLDGDGDWGQSALAAETEQKNSRESIEKRREL
jgi:hypothetical protein